MDIRCAIAALSASALAFAGCGKKDAPPAEASAPAPEATAQMEVQFLPSTNLNAASIQDRLHGAIHPELTARLHLFIDTHGRLPENFYEFANRSMDSVPPVPAGMKFEIDPADKTVKAVRK